MYSGLTSGIGQGLNKSMAHTEATPCDAWKKHITWWQSQGNIPRNWQGFANAWSQALGCPDAFPGIPAGQLGADDRADIEAVKAYHAAGGDGIPLPKGGPPDSNIQPNIQSSIDLSEFMCRFSADPLSMQTVARGKDDWEGVALGSDSGYKYTNEPLSSPKWKTPMCRAEPSGWLGEIDRGARDDDWNGTVSNIMSYADFIAADFSGGGGAVDRPRQGGVGTLAEAWRGTSAVAHTTWKCPTGMVQGMYELFGEPGPPPGGPAPLCFPKSVLPDKYRQNKPRRAIVPHSAGEAIRKAKSAIKKINTYSKTNLGHAPRRRRRTRRESHYHHTHRR